VRIEPTSSGSPTRAGASWVQVPGSSAEWSPWRLPGDGTEVEHRIWLTFLEPRGGQGRGTIDAPDGSVQEQQPSWWLGTALRAASETESPCWPAQASRSIAGRNSARRPSANVREELREWSSEVPGTGVSVIEVPATQRDF
jgi:hypothetical protein